MDRPFWQQSLASLDFPAVAEFIAGGIPEGEHIEYKGPTYNKQSKKVEFTDEVLETVVAFANGDGGMIFYGVHEDKATKKPTIAEGVSVAHGPRDLEGALRNMCASQIEPSVALETKTIAIPGDTPDAGNLLLLIRVRPGRIRPYYLKNRGIYVRPDDSDRLASLRELAALFGASLPEDGPQETPWSQILLNVFGGEHTFRPEVPPYVMIGLTPIFPLDPIAMDEERDAQFQRLCGPLFLANPFLVKLPRGIMHAPFLDDPTRTDTSTGYAFDEGSIGVGVSLHPGASKFYPDAPWQVPLVPLWKMLHRLLTAAQQWPQMTFGYDGPLLCRIAMGNLADAVAVGVGPWSQDIPAGARNKMPGWAIETEWDRATAVDDVIEETLAPLARQLQFPNYHAIKAELRATSLQ